jgi:hypothetical protein
MQRVGIKDSMLGAVALSWPLVCSGGLKKKGEQGELILKVSGLEERLGLPETISTLTMYQHQAN